MGPGFAEPAQLAQAIGSPSDRPFGKGIMRSVWVLQLQHQRSDVKRIEIAIEQRFARRLGQLLGASPFSARSIGERVPRKYCQSKPDTTRTMVRITGARCQISIRPLKHSIILRGSVEKNSFTYSPQASAYSEKLSVSSVSGTRSSDLAKRQRRQRPRGWGPIRAKNGALSVVLPRRSNQREHAMHLHHPAFRLSS
jgi:hypothetical protein